MPELGLKERAAQVVGGTVAAHVAACFRALRARTQAAVGALRTRLAEQQVRVDDSHELAWACTPAEVSMRLDTESTLSRADDPTHSLCVCQCVAGSSRQWGGQW